MRARSRLLRRATARMCATRFSAYHVAKHSRQRSCKPSEALRRTLYAVNALSRWQVQHRLLGSAGKSAICAAPPVVLNECRQPPSKLHHCLPAMTVGAPHVALRDLQQKTLRRRPSGNQQREAGCLARPIPMVEVEDPQVPLSTVDAGVGQQVAIHESARGITPALIADPRPRGNCLGMIPIPGLAAGSAARLPSIPRGSPLVELL